jgi:Transketolase, pyrimidine binding domain
VRLTGQDVERGTFSHRHSVLHCQEVDDIRIEYVYSLHACSTIYVAYNDNLCVFSTQYADLMSCCHCKLGSMNRLEFHLLCKTPHMCLEHRLAAYGIQVYIT